jgi:Double zinc ribbon
MIGSDGDDRPQEGEPPPMDNDPRDRPEDEGQVGEPPAEGEPPIEREPPAGGTPPAEGAPPEAEAWPTEPPAAGSAGEEAWPTEAPERGDDRDVAPTESAPAEPAPAEVEAADSVAAAGAAHTDEPPPGEVEAYPAAAALGDAEPSSEESALPPEAAVAATAAAASAPPSEEIGESTLCPRCGTENRPGLAFCRSCGQRLVAAGVATTVERPGTPEGTMACPRCGTHNRAGVAFCQNCGANLRGTAPGYVPPAAPVGAAVVAAPAERGAAILGPIVLLIGVVGLITGYLLPFLYGNADSLFDRAWGADGYGLAFWTAYPEVEATLADQVYFGLAAPIPILSVLLVVLAVAGFVRAAPGTLQVVGLVIALAWSIGLIVMFLVVEVFGNLGGDLVGMLRELTPAGIIFFLASLIVVIGTLTRFGRS